MKPNPREGLRSSVALESEVACITYPKRLTFRGIEQPLWALLMEGKEVPPVRIHDLRGVQSVLFGAEEIYPLVEMVRRFPSLSKALVVWVVTQEAHRSLVELYRSMVRPWGVTVAIVQTLEEAHLFSRAWRAQGKGATPGLCFPPP